MKIHIKNLKLFEQKKEAIRQAGKGAFYVIADFDKTLTYGTFNGKKIPSIIALLRDGNHLTEDYAPKAHALFNHYHAIEHDSSLSLDYRESQMQEWWEKHNQLLIDSKLRFADIEDIAQNGDLQLRSAVPSFLQKLDENWVPFIIFSASGSGDAIPLFMQHNKCDYSNITYVINRFNRDEEGYAKSFNGEIIHSLNKNEWIFSKLPELKQKLKNRRNVILIGDWLKDAEMAQSSDHEVLLKIWILTLETPELLKAYEEAFDLVLIGDEWFEEVENLLEAILA